MCRNLEKHKMSAGFYGNYSNNNKIYFFIKILVSVKLFCFFFYSQWHPMPWFVQTYLYLTLQLNDSACWSVLWQFAELKQWSTAQSVGSTCRLLLTWDRQQRENPLWSHTTYQVRYLAPPSVWKLLGGFLPKRWYFSPPVGWVRVKLKMLAAIMTLTATAAFDRDTSNPGSELNHFGWEKRLSCHVMQGRRPTCRYENVCLVLRLQTLTFLPS